MLEYEISSLRSKISQPKKQPLTDNQLVFSKAKETFPLKYSSLIKKLEGHCEIPTKVNNINLYIPEQNGKKQRKNQFDRAVLKAKFNIINGKNINDITFTPRKKEEKKRSYTLSNCVTSPQKEKYRLLKNYINRKNVSNSKPLICNYTPKNYTPKKLNPEFSRFDTDNNEVILKMNNLFPEYFQSGGKYNKSYLSNGCSSNHNSDFSSTQRFDSFRRQLNKFFND